MTFSKIHLNTEEYILCCMDGRAYITLYNDEQELKDKFLNNGLIKLTCYPNQFEVTQKGQEEAELAHKICRTRNGWSTE